ncbi:MAG: chemotaxis protein CheW [Thermoanaerobaculia bacterium]
MVNLAKIRRKAKEKKDAPEPEPPKASPPKPSPRAEEKLKHFKETAGQRPEQTQAETATAIEEAPAEGAEAEMLTFVVAGEQYAIDIDRIAEIIAPRRPTPVPNAPPSVIGIISLRGTIVTMLDLRRALGHPPGDAGIDSRTIVVEDRGGLAGFAVDRVLRVVKVHPSQIQTHPVVSATEQTDAIRGVFRAGAALTIVLDVDRVLSHA